MGIRWSYSLKLNSTQIYIYDDYDEDVGVEDDNENEFMSLMAKGI